MALLITALVLVPTQQKTLSQWFSQGDTSVGTLTGRTQLWSELFPHVLDSPLFGIGPGATRFQRELTVSTGSTVGQSHNSLLEVLISGGLPAAALWIAMMTSLGGVASAVRDPYRSFAVAVWASAIVYSITLGQMAGFGMPWYLLLSLFALPEKQRQTAHPVPLELNTASA